MCMSCGCGQPHEDHGNADNITYEDLSRAAEAAGITPDEAGRNISDAMAKV